MEEDNAVTVRVRGNGAEAVLPTAFDIECDKGKRLKLLVSAGHLAVYKALFPQLRRVIFSELFFKSSLRIPNMTSCAVVSKLSSCNESVIGNVIV